LLRFARDGFTLDLVFEAIAEPNVFGSDAADALENAFRLHFEQPGRVRGSVEVDGERMAVDCFSIRDGSHGRRFLETPTPGGYTWSTADEQTSWHVLARDQNRTHDTVVVAGYLLRDGEMAPIVHGVRRVVERAGPRPNVVEVVAEDARGRNLHAVGRAQTAAEFMLFPDHGQWWTLFRWEYDGFTDAVGEDQEYYGIQDFRRWHRAGPEAWTTR
jgi:hypothetical protein